MSMKISWNTKWLLCGAFLCFGCSDSAQFEKSHDVIEAGDATPEWDLEETLDLITVEEIKDTDAGPPPFPPVVPGPPPELFDCSAKNNPLPERKSPHPIDCILDPECTAKMVVGHRGAGGELASIAPENSLEGIRAALWMGLDGVEIDVRHTSDDVLVLMHDSSLDRTTTSTGVVSDFPASEVLGIPLILPHKSAAVGDFSCSVVSTLTEAFELTRDRVFVDLDVKTHRIDLVVAAIEEAGLIDQVFVSVSDYQKAVEARTLNPDIRIQVRPDSPEELAEIMTKLERPPEIVEIPVMKVPEMSESIHDLGGKVFADVWGADARAYVQGNFDRYLEIYDEGADVLQSELVPLLLQVLDRWDY
jgi:glycerophosphoryl diester phosphodiesterase